MLAWTVGRGGSRTHCKCVRLVGICNRFPSSGEVLGPGGRSLSLVPIVEARQIKPTTPSKAMITEIFMVTAISKHLSGKRPGYQLEGHLYILMLKSILVGRRSNMLVDPAVSSYFRHIPFPAISPQDQRGTTQGSGCVKVPLPGFLQ